MRACVRFDDRVCFGWFVVEHGLRQRAVLAPLLFNILLMVAINAVYTYFKVDIDIMDALVHLKDNKMVTGGGGRRGGATAGEPALATSLWGRLYEDNAGVTRNRPSGR